MPNEEGKWNLAIVGATGLVGNAVLEKLAQATFPLGDVFLLASERSAGSSLEFGKRRLVVHELDGFGFEQVDMALFCVPESVSREYVPVATKTGCVVIDLSPAFRMQADVPLVAAAINPEALAGYANHNLVACPDSSVLHTLMVLHPLISLSPLKSMHAVYMRAVSEMGRAGVDELSQQTIALFNLKPIESRVFDQQIAFNVLARAGRQDGAGREFEQSLQSELKKILEDPDIGINVAAVQVPVFYAHSACLHIDLQDNFSMERTRTTLSSYPWICLLDEPGQDQSPSAVTHATNDDLVYIGRLRRESGREKELDCWLVADNIRAAANNGVLVAEILVKGYL